MATIIGGEHPHGLTVTTDGAIHGLDLGAAAGLQMMICAPKMIQTPAPINRSRIRTVVVFQSVGL